MVQRRAELRLAREALLHIDGAVGMQALYGNLAREALVLAQDDRRHATGAEMPQYAVAAIKK